VYINYREILESSISLSITVLQKKVI